MFNVRLAGGYLYGKQLLTWLSLQVSFMASFVLSFFPLDVLDGILDLIESVSEGFLTYSSTSESCVKSTCNINKICTMSSLISKKPLTGYDMQPYWPRCGSIISMQI